MRSAACRNVSRYLNVTHSTWNLTVKVNTKEGLEVLVGYLPHSKGLLGGVGKEAQEDADGVLRWDGKEVDIAGMRQAKEALVTYSSKCQKITFKRRGSLVFLGKKSLEKLHPWGLNVISHERTQPYVVHPSQAVSAWAECCVLVEEAVSAHHCQSCPREHRRQPSCSSQQSLLNIRHPARVQNSSQATSFKGRGMVVVYPGVNLGRNH